MNCPASAVKGHHGTRLTRAIPRYPRRCDGAEPGTTRGSFDPSRSSLQCNLTQSSFARRGPEPDHCRPVVEIFQVFNAEFSPLMTGRWSNRPSDCPLNYAIRAPHELIFAVGYRQDQANSTRSWACAEVNHRQYCARPARPDPQKLRPMMLYMPAPTKNLKRRIGTILNRS